MRSPGRARIRLRQPNDGSLPHESARRPGRDPASGSRAERSGAKRKKGGLRDRGSSSLSNLTPFVPYDRPPRPANVVKHFR